MPIRAYFLVMAPALAALLWWTSWYMQPEPPKVYTTAAARTAPAVRAVKQAPATTGAAASQTAAQSTPTGEPAPDVTGIELVPTVEDTKWVQDRKSTRLNSSHLGN